jgi:hypothetical protein
MDINLGTELGKLRRRLTKVERPVVASGIVISTGPPPEIRIDGDTADTPIPLKLDSYTPTTNDRVLLVQAFGRWVILGDFS